MKANYHTHTRWCNHATGEIEDYILEAIRHGFQEIAITEHVPRKDNRDPRRMRWEEFPIFNQELDEAIVTYKDQIHVIKGFECEYYPEDMESYQMFRDAYHYNLMILGQHRSGEHHQIDNFGAKGAEEMLIYAGEVVAGIKTGFFNFLAHPDLVLQNYCGRAWDENCQRTMRQIFTACEEYGIPVEINGNGLRGHRAYPSRQSFAMSRDYQLQYLINSDAHQVQALYDNAIVEAEQMAADLQLPITEIYSYHRS